MAFTDNYGHPRGLLGQYLLTNMDKKHRPMAEWSFTQFEIPEKGDILDIGCGGGYNIKRMLSRCPMGRFVGYDISATSVRKARAVNRGEQRVKILQGSVEKMPFETGSFDLVTAFETVYFWPGIASCFREVYRVLKPGGHFAVICNYGDPSVDLEKKVPCMTRYNADQIQSLMESAAFVNVSVSRREHLFCVIGKVDPEATGVGG